MELKVLMDCKMKKSKSKENTNNERLDFLGI